MSGNQASCVFCKIIAGELPSSQVYIDEDVVAFLDIRPVNPGHTLVVPKVHAPGLSELDPRIGGRLFQVAMRIAAALRRSGLRCEGVNLWLADGRAAFQEVPHVHLHVVPRFQGDGFRLYFGPDYGKTPPAEEMAETAKRIRDALSQLEK